MGLVKPEMISFLKKQILSLHGFKHLNNENSVEIGVRQINKAFPRESFPLGAVHEFVCSTIEDASATSGFISALISPLLRNGEALIWINSSGKIFPPALKSFGIDPDKIIFINIQKEKDILWVLEEALKCKGLAAVVAELKDLNFTASRRLQLAVEKSSVTAFIVRQSLTKPGINACLSRWRITSLPSISENGLPGIGFPGWNVELLKVRNGKPGSWEIHWINGGFRHALQSVTGMLEQKKKAG